MLKAMAVIRTLFLIFIIGYTVRATPLTTAFSRTFDEQYARCSTSLGLLVKAAWLAVAWITLETIVGWIMAVRKPGKTAVAVSHPTGP
jgi:hypothetical protein